MAVDEEDPSRCDDFPTDTLVEILRRLPPNCRRRSRLVCRQWRDTVHERTMTDLRSRAKTLLVSSGAAYVLDDKWEVKRLMAIPKGRRRVIHVVGTCNGLICFCDDSKPGGAISLANPANGERLELPPLPCADNFMRGQLRYGFAHHEGTGRYKVVRIPCCFDRKSVQVFTLGETSWRDVATPTVGSSGARSLRCAGNVSADGAVYWVADGNERIMSFDLEAECVTAVKPLPVPLQTRPLGSIYLAEVYGRLGIAIIHGSAKQDEKTTDVWVLECARGEHRWRRWYSVEMSVQPPPLLTRPHFAHANHVLTRGDGANVVHKHKPNGTRERLRMIQISESNRGTEAVKGDPVYQAFDYVETKEPLNLYKLW